MKSVLCTWLLKVTLHPCLWAVQVKQAMLVKKYILPVTTLDFLPVQVYAQKSSRPSQQPPAAIWSTDKMQAGNAQLFPGWLTHFLQQHTGHLPGASPKSLIYWGCASRTRCTCRGRCSHLPPAWEPAEDSSRDRAAAPGRTSSVHHLFPGALGEAGTIQSGSLNELPDARVHHSHQISVPQGQHKPPGLLCLPSPYLCSEPKASLAEAHLPERHLGSTSTLTRRKNHFCSLICLNSWSHPLLKHTPFEYLKHPTFSILLFPITNVILSARL